MVNNNFVFHAAKLQKTFGLCKFASNSATVVVADGACGHEAQAVLFADVVEFDCCHTFLSLEDAIATGRSGTYRTLRYRTVGDLQDAALQSSFAFVN